MVRIRKYCDQGYPASHDWLLALRFATVLLRFRANTSLCSPPVGGFMQQADALITPALKEQFGRFFAWRAGIGSSQEAAVSLAVAHRGSKRTLSGVGFFSIS